MVTKTILGKVIDCKYYPQQKSIAVLIKDIENDRQVKPIQIHASNFSFSDPTKVDQEMEKTSELLRNYKFPVRIVFDPKTLEEERAWFGDRDAIKNVFGEEWAQYIKNLAERG